MDNQRPFDNQPGMQNAGRNPDPAQYSDRISRWAAGGSDARQ